jgi:hypothetical protein
MTTFRKLPRHAPARKASAAAGKAVPPGDGVI